VLNIPLEEHDAGDALAPDISGCVHISGPRDLVLTLHANAALAERAALALLESDEPLQAADLPETFAELLNVIAGNLTGMLEDARFTRPVVACGSPIAVPNARGLMRVDFHDDAAGRQRTAGLEGGDGGTGFGERHGQRER